MRGARLIRPVVIVVLWTCCAVLLAAQSYLRSSIAERPQPFDELLLRALVTYWTWAAFTVPILGLAEWAATSRQRRSLLLPMLLAGGFLFAGLHAMVRASVNHLLNPDDTLSRLEAARFYFISNVYSDQWSYWSVLLLGFGLVFYGKFRDRELKAAQLETQLVQSQLQVLRVQLHPHFLFNTLNSVAALMRRDVDAAERMLTQLSELLRMALDNTGVQEVTLKEELDFLQKYLGIQQTRFQDRLQVMYDIDEEALHARVPALILQPLVENAVVHGIAPYAVSGRIQVSALREGNELRLGIRDNGPGLPATPPAKTREGVGLSNTRARLLRLYGDAQRFQLQNLQGGGVEATVVLPFIPDRDGAADGEEIFSLTDYEPARPTVEAAGPAYADRHEDHHR